MTDRPDAIATLLAAILLSLLCLGGSCKTPDAQPPVDAGDPAADAGEPDAGPADAGPVVCQGDEDCAVPERCDNAARRCIPAAPCQDDPSTCPDIDSYCDSTVGLGCRCIPSPEAQEPYNGFCKRRLAACTPCTRDEECGSDPVFFQTDTHNDGRCVDFGGTKVCLERYNSPTKCGSSCGKALVIGQTSFCVPQSESCADGAFVCCSGNASCPSEHPLCDQGLCKDACSYDFALDQTLGCRSDQVCNVDPDLLTETSFAWGAGRCSPPCTGDQTCKLLRSDFVCRTEANGMARCRPPGCISDLECPDPAPDSPYRGYCERSSGQCRPDTCRTGTDPIVGTTYQDCKPGYKCSPSSAGNTCELQDCLEQGGAALACNWDEFCCGEDRNHSGGSSDDACPAGVNPGVCYPAPRPPWCAADCQKDDECRGAGTPTNALDVNLCLSDGQTSFCGYACTYRTECPKGYTCNEIPIVCDPTQAEACNNTPANCFDSGKKDQDGNPISFCRCTTPQQKGAPCGDGERCDDAGTHCIASKLCLKSRNNCK